FQFLLLLQSVVIHPHRYGRRMAYMFSGIICGVDSLRRAETSGFNKINTRSDTDMGSLIFLSLQLHKLLIVHVRFLYKFIFVFIRKQHQKLIRDYPGKKYGFNMFHFFYKKVTVFFQKLIAYAVAAFLIEVFKTLKITVQHCMRMRILAYDQMLCLHAETGEREQAGQTVVFCPAVFTVKILIYSLASGQMCRNDFRHFSQLLAVLLGPVALFSAHDIGYGACIFALAVHRRVEYRLGSALHQKRSPVGGIHSHIVMLENSSLIIVITLEQSQEIFFCKAAGCAESFRSVFGHPLILPGSVLFFNISADDSDPVKLKTVSDHLHEKFDGNRKTALLFENLKGCGNNIIMQITDINIAL